MQVKHLEDNMQYATIWGEFMIILFLNKEIV